MNKLLFVGFCLLAMSTNWLYSQNNTIESQSECWKDTTLLIVDKIKEYLYVPKKNNKDGSHIVVYIIKARYADEKHKRFNTSLILVSTDTIIIHKKNKSFYCFDGINHNSTLVVGNSYLFHLELCGCLPMVLGNAPNYYDVDEIRLPVEICPLQPFLAKELNGLVYSPFSNDQPPLRQICNPKQNEIKICNPH